jgi:hypothetical protein
MYWQIRAILEEVITLLKEQYAQRPRLTLAAGLVAGLLFLRGTGCVASALLTTRPPEEFAYLQVRGTVHYADGSAIPANGLLVCFFQRPRDGSPRVHSLGCTTMAAGRNEFSMALRLDEAEPSADMVVATIASPAGDALPTEIVPEEYAKPHTSPLLVDPTSRSIELRIRKP